MSEARFLAEAARLARAGIGEVEPNPPVGALVVRGGEVVGAGHHRCYGGPHAEVEALRDAGPAARGATVVVTLEPCSSTGKTPPCTEALLAAGVRRVVAGAVDPDPRHAGRGIAWLRARGVEAEVIEDAECARLIERFRRLVARDRPYVIAKWAMTLDGKIATRGGDSRWISNESARARVHELRGRVDAIAVGRRTVETDDPRLTARPPGPRTPWRVVFDRRLAVPEGWCALADGGPPVCIVHASGADPARAAALAARGCRLLAIEASDPGTFLEEALRRLRGEGVHRVLVEGGAALHGALFDGRLVDRLVVFVGPKLFGGTDALSAIGGLGIERVTEGPRLVDGRFAILDGDAAYEAFVEW